MRVPDAVTVMEKDQKTAIDWNNFICQICGQSLDHSIVLVGPGKSSGGD